MKTELLTKPHKNLDQEAFAKHVLHLEPKDVNLKFIFDHIRNYAICGALAWAGVKVYRSAGVELDDMSRIWALVGGAVLTSLPVPLFVLNFVHGIKAAFTLQDSKHISLPLYLAVTTAFFIGALKFMLLAKAA